MLKEAIISRDGIRAGELVTDGTRRNLQYVLAELGGSSPTQGRHSPPGREPTWLVEDGGHGVAIGKEVAVG
jgi:hypothetical protein